MHHIAQTCIYLKFRIMKSLELFHHMKKQGKNTV